MLLGDKEGVAGTTTPTLCQQGNLQGARELASRAYPGSLPYKVLQHIEHNSHRQGTTVQVQGYRTTVGTDIVQF